MDDAPLVGGGEPGADLPRQRQRTIDREAADAAEQRRRLQAEMDAKERLYGERYPLDEDFLAALAGIPAASGVAMGFDRLVMLVAGATRIEQVLWSPLPAME